MITDVKQLAQSAAVFPLSLELRGQSQHLIACQISVRDVYNHEVELYKCDLDGSHGVAFIPINSTNAKTLHIGAIGIDPVPDGSPYLLKITLLKFGKIYGTPKVLKGKDCVKTWTTMLT